MKLAKRVISRTGFMMILALMISGAAGSEASSKATEEGVALGIVYDTSGSMNERVKDGQGGQSPKNVIAKRAMNAIVERLRAFAANSPANEPRRIKAGLVVFRNGRAVSIVPLQPFEPGRLTREISGLKPAGSTPLGQAMRLAAMEVLHSNLTRKHVLVITDGVNTTGPEPAVVLPQLKAEAERQNLSLAVHFVAFDIDAKVFDPLKKLGALVVGASDEKQLNAQLEYILEKKILLEEEGPAPTVKTNHQQ